MLGYLIDPLLVSAPRILLHHQGLGLGEGRGGEVGVVVEVVGGRCTRRLP